MGDAAVYTTVGVRAVQREGVEVGECGWVVRRLFNKNKQKNGGGSCVMRVYMTGGLET
jgi:hypothetical protein